MGKVRLKREKCYWNRKSVIVFWYWDTWDRQWLGIGPDIAWNFDVRLVLSKPEIGIGRGWDGIFVSEKKKITFATPTIVKGHGVVHNQVASVLALFVSKNSHQWNKAVRIRSQRHHMIKNCHLRDFWLEKISKPGGASPICTKSKFCLQQNVDNINTWKLLRLDFPKRVLWWCPMSSKIDVS